MYYLIDNYTSEILDESDDRAELETALSELQAETGLFIYSIVEAPSKEALLELEKLARETVSNLIVDNPQVIEVVGSMLEAILSPDNQAERYISGIQSTCGNCGYQEMIEIPEQAEPTDIIQAMQAVRDKCPECQERARLLQAKQELIED